MMPQRLYTPGPVRIPQAILDACARPPMHHRTTAFRELSERIWQNLQRTFLTKEPVVVLAGSSMTGIEAVAWSLHKPGDQALVIEHGRFGERIGHILGLAGVTVQTLRAPWGRSVSVDDVMQAIDEAGDLASIWLVHSETSTGVTLDLEGIARAVRAERPDIMICVDAVSSIAVHEVKVDEWELDAVICGTQKGLMCPPGLACLSLSNRARRHLDTLPQRIYTLNLHEVLAHRRKGLFVWTPPVTLLAGLDTALDIILEEGMEHVWARHMQVTNRLHRELTGRGFALFGEASSHALTAVLHDRSEDIRQALEEWHGIIVAGGQDHLHGTMLRIGTCGSMTSGDIRDFMTAFDDVCSTLDIDRI